MRRLAVALLLATACGPSKGVRDTGLEGLRLDAADPGMLVAGSTLVLRGQSFVDLDYGSSKLVFDGFAAQAPAQFTLPARYVSSSRMEVEVDAAFVAAVGGRLDGTLEGSLAIEVRSSVDSQLHR